MILPLATLIADSPPATLTVKINAEARVSVDQTGPLPVAQCGEPLRIMMDVQNESGSRAELRVTSTSALVHIGPQERLSGAPLEQRALVVELQGATPIEAAFDFDAGPATGDIAWRSRTHLLLTCVRPTR